MLGDDGTRRRVQGGMMVQEDGCVEMTVQDGCGGNEVTKGWVCGNDGTGGRVWGNDGTGRRVCGNDGRKY